jgi:hypothetical protein
MLARHHRRGSFRTTALLLGLAVPIAGGPAVAIEQPAYRVERTYEDFEIRTYPPYLVAETETSGNRGEAANEGFRRLAAYIFGNNRVQAKLAMTAPVTQAAATRIAMTAPVTQVETDRGGVGDGAGEGKWVIQFAMPSPFTLETLPVPLDPAIRLREMPARRLAVLRYSGSWSEARYEEHLRRLRQALAREDLTAVGEPVWARYDPPFKPWFLRTNEILLELAE